MDNKPRDWTVPDPLFSDVPCPQERWTADDCWQWGMLLNRLCYYRNQAPAATPGWPYESPTVWLPWWQPCPLTRLLPLPTARLLYRQHCEFVLHKRRAGGVIFVRSTAPENHAAWCPVGPGRRGEKS